MTFYRPIALGLALASVHACASPGPPILVDIVAVDYAYQAPRSIRPGLTAFRFTNRGTVLHEIQLFRLRPEIPRDSAIHYLATATATDSLAPGAAGSVLWAPAGITTHERILVDAAAGETYAIFCQFRNADSLPMHTQLGMIGLIAVETSP